MLTPERWREVERIFDEALALPVADRVAFVASRCQGDPELQREIESLLAADAGSDAGAGLVGDAASDWAGGGDPDSLVGRDIDGYRVISLLGAGGMGEVYVARELSLRRQVALKVLPEEFSANDRRVRLFADEALAASALNHPNIVTVYRIGEFEGRQYIATELVDGDTLRARIVREPLAASEALGIAVQIASALSQAHDAGIVHRDIKPENIVIRFDGLVKVIDFGLAKLEAPDSCAEAPGLPRRSRTRVGAVVGTIDYMAPEQAAGGVVDHRADLYSLSVVLHEMLTGLLPRASAIGTDREPGSGSPPIPSGLRSVIRRGLAADPAARYQSAGEFRRDLLAVQDPTGVAEARASRVRRAIAATLAVAATAALLSWGIPAIWRSAPAGSGAADVGDPVADVTSLAVLPFRTIGQNADDQYLGFGIADAVITRLGDVRQLRVRPSTSVREFTDATLDPLDAGRKLKVDHILSGLVQRDGDRVRVTVQLVDVSDGAQRWTSRIDLRSSDLFTLQDTVAERVVTALAVRNGPGEPAGPAPRQTANPEAYQIYLQARYYLARVSRADIERSLALFQQAVGLDPGYALAHAGIATAHRKLATNFTQGASPLDGMPLARAAAVRALALNADLPEALVILGGVQFQYDYDWSAAEASLKKAVLLGPNVVDARRGLGWLLAGSGRIEEAVRELQRAVDLDPGEALSRENLACVLEFGGRSAEALETLDGAIRVDPLNPRPFGRRAWMLEVHQRFDEALASRQAGLRVAGRGDEAERLGRLYAKGGQRALLDDTARRPGPKDPIGAAWTHMQLGNREAALAELERGAREKHSWMVVTKVDPRFASLRGQPRFRALMQQIGL